eukprot:CAMPEP_0181359660 /NCGR_PEP_ID=MMETSP1106-20121128/6219_1 /TAXON_ID=81844 /ORGANISM="Mantoniella antarctica, Strain SL-175" /LENGTH=987 /DNA_ID=CAMNT_0023472817 /DNA_START=213 /DNA_END=3176 /DNA_ORIENTATION=-
MSRGPVAGGTARLALRLLLCAGCARSSSQTPSALGDAAGAVTPCSDEDGDGGGGAGAASGFKVTVSAYYINLDRHPERAAAMERSYRGASKLVRVEGFDAPLRSDLVASSGLLPISSTTDDPDSRRDSIGRLGSIGCTVSHLRAVATAYDAGETIALILEDDQSNDFAPRWVDASLSDYISRLPANWRIVNLGAFFPETFFFNRIEAAAPGDVKQKQMMAEWVAAWERAGRPAAMPRPLRVSLDPRLASVLGGTAEHWGSSALLVNRAGMRALLDTYPRCPGGVGFDLSKAPCSEYDTCVVGVPFLETPQRDNGENQSGDEDQGDGAGAIDGGASGGGGNIGGFYEATPPLFVQSAATESDLQHDNGDVLRKFRSFTRQWLDIARGAGADAGVPPAGGCGGSGTATGEPEFYFGVLDALEAEDAAFAHVMRLEGLGEGEFTESLAASLGGVAAPAHIQPQPAAAAGAAPAQQWRRRQLPKIEVELEDEEDAMMVEESARGQHLDNTQDVMEGEPEKVQGMEDHAALVTRPKPAKSKFRLAERKATPTISSSTAQTLAPNPGSMSANPEPRASSTRRSFKAAAATDIEESGEKRQRKGVQKEEGVSKADKIRADKTMPDPHKVRLGKHVKHVEEEGNLRGMIKPGRHAPVASIVKVTKKQTAAAVVEEDEDDVEENKVVFTKAGKSTRAATIRALEAALAAAKEEEYEAASGQGEAVATTGTSHKQSTTRHNRISAEETRALQGLPRLSSAMANTQAVAEDAARAPSVASLKVAPDGSVRKSVSVHDKHDTRVGGEEVEERGEDREEEGAEGFFIRTSADSHRQAVAGAVSTTVHPKAARKEAAAHHSTVPVRKMAVADHHPAVHKGARGKLVALGDVASGAKGGDDDGGESRVSKAAHETRVVRGAMDATQRARNTLMFSDPLWISALGSDVRALGAGAAVGTAALAGAVVAAARRSRRRGGPGISYPEEGTALLGAAAAAAQVDAA